MSYAILQLEGLTSYEDAHALQQELIIQRLAGVIPDLLLILEHEPVITVGRARGAAESVRAPGALPIIQVERGGDATWHGPGQLVVYPIIHLPPERRDLHRHLQALEEAIIRTLSRLGVAAGRDPRNTGVWVPRGAADAKKIASIGIACRRWVTWHGLALNVEVDLSAFRAIRPCGFDPAIMTDLAATAPDLHLDVRAIADLLVEDLAATLELRGKPQRGSATDAHLDAALVALRNGR